ncbi:MAG TPA: hypothetical protein VFI59_01675 [Actinomycetota bacterium]|nr:hypothetical protein [Actinomycetota bacterium]
MRRSLTFTAVAALIGALIQSVSAVEPSAVDCLARPSTTVKAGTDATKWRAETLPDNHAIDARTYVNTAYPFVDPYPISLGNAGEPTNLCIVGGRTVGQQSENLTWNQIHDTWHGGGLRIYGAKYVVNGWRIRNTADGFQPRDGENWTLVNNYYEYIRDDCVENDDRLSGAIYDSLFDGCYTGLSEQDAGTVAGESLILDGVLMRLQPMPGPYKTNDPTILGHGSFFKKFDDGGRHKPIIRNSVFVAEKFREDDPKDWPPGTTMSNVTVVWLGQGAFPMSTLPGMTLTTNRSVWDNARADWLSRHGCTAFGSCSEALYDPSVSPSQGPSPSVSPTVSPSPSPSPSPTVSPTVSPSPSGTAEVAVAEIVACVNRSTQRLKKLRCIRQVLRSHEYIA